MELFDLRHEVPSLVGRRVLRVPLVLRYPPGVEAGGCAHHPVEARDIVPTVLEPAGVAETSDLNGPSLFWAEDGEVFSSLRHDNVAAHGPEVASGLGSGRPGGMPPNELPPEEREVRRSLVYLDSEEE
jgi:hypothetical protein